MITYLYYIHYMTNISDDTSHITTHFNQLKLNFLNNTTTQLDFREKALDQLIHGYTAMIPQIDKALKEDLGYNAFMSNFVAHNAALTEVKDLRANLRKWAQTQTVDTPISIGVARSEVIYEPLGVALVISAWNYPIYTAIPQVAAAIAAGNCVILKPSEFAPYTSNVLSMLFQKYMDQRFYRVIEGRVEIAKALTKLKFDIICFTGSTETGRLVAIEAAKNLTPCILELGGKCPVIVDESANIDSAVKRIVFGKYVNSGQTCVGVDHVYVQQKIYKQFKSALLAEIKNAFEKSDNLGGGDYAKINNVGHLRKLERLLKDNGGQLLYGGTILQDQLYFSPTLIENPNKHSCIANQEIFGPIMPLYSYTDLQHLIAEIRVKPKPLVVYLFSENNSHIQYVKTHTSSGAFVVNDTVVQVLNCHLPFGGVGDSGYGRYHGQSGFISFSNPKSICYTTAFNAYPLSTRFFPYDDSKKRVLTFLLKIGDTTYGQLKKGSAVLALIIAGAVAYLKLRPFL